MRKIALTQGKFALVDDRDYYNIKQYKWRAIKKKNDNTFYAHGWVKGKSVQMHRFIMNAQKGQMTDHENHNGLDNQRVNLRICTNSQNQHNQLIRQGTSKYKGVDWHKHNKQWRARIKINKDKRIELGGFKSERAAAIAYNQAAIKYHGRFASLNGIEASAG